MNRRTFLRALAALPVVGAVPALAKWAKAEPKPCEAHVTHECKVVPFTRPDGITLLRPECTVTITYQKRDGTWHCESYKLDMADMPTVNSSVWTATV